MGSEVGSLLLVEAGNLVVAEAGRLAELEGDAAYRLLFALNHKLYS